MAKKEVKAKAKMKTETEELGLIQSTADLKQYLNNILDKMKDWLEKSLKHAVPQSKLSNALLYMQQRWEELTHYLIDGRLEIDNNGAENQIRPFALGRKNWLFSGSPRGAHASALFYSLIATAVANGCNPFDYLKHLFENIRKCKTHDDYVNLLPFNILPKPN